MKKLLALATLSFALVPSAHAGPGTTAWLGGYTDGTTWFPSLDYRQKGVLVQLHALELLDGIQDGGYALNTGVDVTYLAFKKKVAPEVEGVVMPGAGVRVADRGDIGFGLMAQARVGMEMKQGAGFGVYVVPAVGVSNLLTGDLGLETGGTLQVSAWFAGK